MKYLKAVLWNGNNLKEVISFTGRSPRFDEWFNSWDEFEKFVKEHDGIVKLFAKDGTNVEVRPGTWIVKTPEGICIPLVDPWPSDKQ